ncbi:Gfo/Idh/MocA family protein [Terrabacter terrigena]|uniref:Gfo/Idh/MocA family protein n=1 Tax=Terrabacter terrigena TaxID=574718 RepID=A0ABW3N1U2_9MICO
MSTPSAPLRIGLLGASRISDLAVIGPATETGHQIVAVAARDPDRARVWASSRGIERVHASYADLLADPHVEVVYNALPNGLHAPWNIAALRAGKHVLSEKPFASNAAEAEQVREAAQVIDPDGRLVVFEAFHYWYHPVFQRLLEVIGDGTIGELEHLHVNMSMPAPAPTDLRWSWDLAGGCLMDLGCYCIHAIRSVAGHLGGAPELTGARALERAGHPDVDEQVHLEFDLPHGATAVADATMNGAWDFSITATGAAGRATVANFVNVHTDDRLVIEGPDGVRTEHLGSRSTYTYQMDALAAAIREGRPFPTGMDDAVENMRAIDAGYSAAGMPARPTQAGEPSAVDQRSDSGSEAARR